MYKLSNAENIVINTQDGSSFDSTSGHPFALAYQQWRDGYTDQNGVEHPAHTPEPADPIQLPSIRVSAAQFHMALIQLNLFDQVQAATAQNQLLQVFFERSPYFVSDDPKIIAVASTLGLQGQINAVFELADSL